MLNISSRLPSQPREVDTFLRRQIRWVLLLRVILYSLILGSSSLLQAHRHALNIPPLLYILLFIITVYLFSILSELIIRKILWLRYFVYLQLLVDSILISLIVHFTGGALSIFPILYFFPILSGGIILHKIGGLAVASLNTILYGSVLFANYVPIINNLPKYLLPTSAVDVNISFQALSVYGLSFFLTAILSSVLSVHHKYTREQLSKTEDDLGRLNLLYKQIFNDITSGIITVDAEKKITSFNVAAEDISGYKRSDVLGSKINVLLPDLRETADQYDRQSVLLVRKDQEKIHIGYSWAKLNLPGDNKESRVYTLQDLHKIKQMEAKVQQAEKMAAIGEIAAGIAHEFRNPLAAISGAAQILDKEPSQSETNSSLLAIISRECSRLENNINDFLQFSKPANPDKNWLSITSILDESMAVIKQIPGINDKCLIKRNIPKNLDCWADHHQIKQVLINLIHNSTLAISKNSGDILVSANEITSKDGKESTLIEIIDSGPGIEEKLLNSIFEPFFTTRENGTGLGLAIVKQIVDSHGGTIQLQTTFGKGTSFGITLPLP